MASACIREMQIDQAPLGLVFHDSLEPSAKERECFAGWISPYRNPHAPRNNAVWRVRDEDDGKRCLEFRYKDVARLLTGEQDWSDYALEASVRQMGLRTVPCFDDEYRTVSQSGLLFRQADLRRYYLFCMEGQNRVVLYRREDANYHVLAEKRMPLDRARYYQMKVTCQGHTISCEFDGKSFCQVDDPILPAGLAGIDTNSHAAFRGVRLSCSEQSMQAVAQLRDKQARALADLRQKYPKPVLWKTIPMPCGHSQMTFGNLRRSDTKDIILLVNDPKGRHVWWQKLVAIDLSGKVLWEKVPADDNNPYRIKAHGGGGMAVTDVNGDGLDEVVTAYDGMIRILRGSDGAVLKEAPLPKGGVYGKWRDQPLRQSSIYPVQWQKSPAPKGFAMMEEYASNGGNCLIALDSDLKEMWRYYMLGVNYGHILDMYDIDGDGRDEIFAGFECVNADGRCVWRLEGTEYEDYQCGGLHVDHVSVADFDGDGEPEIFMCGGGMGFFLAKARTGELIVRHRNGHSQVAYAAQYFPDQPGLQILNTTLHGNPGILCFFDGKGRPLNRFQPNDKHEASFPVNWTGDGQELTLVTGTYDTFGLWDAQGRKVVDRWITEKEHQALVRGWQWSRAPLDGEGRDQIVMQFKNELKIYRQDRPFEGQRMYVPRRRTDMWPGISLPAWKTMG